MKALYICDECRVAEAVVLCKEYRCGLEIQSFYDPSYIVREPDAVEKHRANVGEVARRSFHGPFGDLCAGSFDPMVRDLTRYRMEGAVTLASELDTHRIVLHHGYIPGTSSPDGWLKRSTSFWKEFLSEKGDNFRCHIENHLERDTQLLGGLVDAVGDPRFSVCLDIGHVHCFAKGNPVEWIEKLGARIGYVHLHDNSGDRDMHLGLGEGTIPLIEVCGALEQHAPAAIWAVEAKFDKMRLSLDWLKHHGYA